MIVVDLIGRSNAMASPPRQLICELAALGLSPTAIEPPSWKRCLFRSFSGNPRAAGAGEIKACGKV